MAKTIDLKTAKSSWYEEKRSAFLYRYIAVHEKNQKYKELFLQLGEEAEKQAEMWGNEIVKNGITFPSFKPDLRTRLITLLVHRFGTKKMRPILAAMKVRGMSVYLEKQTPTHPWPKTIEDVGRGHKSLSSGNNIRAAVFGVNDGLVSNASLIMGMIGSQADVKMTVLAGIAGLLAGAFSMGAGEYISVRSQREMFEKQIALEKEELELYPAEETEELALIYHARGLAKEEADKVASLLMQDHANALDTLAREELGINPDDLVSPYGAAFFSFISFTIGALIPLLPFLGNLFLQQHHSIEASIVLTGAALFTVGAVLSLYTGRNALFSGLRMLFIGAVAGSITYLIGHLLGVQLS